MHILHKKELRRELLRENLPYMSAYTVRSIVLRAIIDVLTNKYSNGDRHTLILISDLLNNEKVLKEIVNIIRRIEKDMNIHVLEYENDSELLSMAELRKYALQSIINTPLHRYNGLYKQLYEQLKEYIVQQYFEATNN